VRRRFFAPEEIQTSAVDCGPAALKILLAGFGIQASYGRLREACQTDVDGTSIDAIEDAAIALGLDATQGLLPLEHLLLPAAQALPALVVTRTPSRLAHFVIAWRVHGPWVQLSDPAVGRRWVQGKRFLEEEVLCHPVELPAEAFRDWAGTGAFTRPLVERLRAIGVGGSAEVLVEEALRDGSWRGIAALDAATRFAGRTLDPRVGAAHAEALVRALTQRPELIPPAAWTARLAAGDGEGAVVTVRGAVVITARESRETKGPSTGASPELLAARAPSVGPWRTLWSILQSGGAAPLAATLALVVLLAAAEPFEALVLRAFVASGPRTWPFLLGAAIAAVVSLVAVCTARLGARLDRELWRRFLSKVPRLEDRYLRSRPLSDMARTAHAIPALRALPRLLVRIATAGLGVVAVTVALAALAPDAIMPALFLGLGAVATPLACWLALAERDHRRDAHAGGLGRYHLEALLGLVPLRAHRGAASLAGEHERLLAQWLRAARAFDGLSLVAVGVEAAVSIVLLVAVLRAAHPADGPTMLLVAYLALRAPMHGRALTAAVRDLAPLRSTLVRILEPLGAPEPHSADVSEDAEMPKTAGVAVTFEGVETKAGGHVLLSGIDLSIPARAHVAVVGPSGAGKSTLVGLLLGWCRVSAGTLRVDGAPLAGARLRALRQATAWVEPTVRLWNRSLDENLRYGNEADDAALAVEGAGLSDLLAGLPEGAATVLGEGGHLLAGGAAQRVRFGRALLRTNVRLAILDEPFRGLPRGERRDLLARARARWRDATLLAVTHDIEETRTFDRVLVVEDGRVVEDGAPTSLDRAGTRYHALLEAQRAAERELGESRAWRRMVMRGGAVSASPAGERAAAPVDEAAGVEPAARQANDLAWPMAKLGEAIARVSHGALAPANADVPSHAPLADQVERAAADQGLEAESLQRIPTAAELRRGHALLFLPGRASFLLVTPAFAALLPDGSRVPPKRARAAVLGALAAAAEQGEADRSLAGLFAELGLPLAQDAATWTDGAALPAPGFLLYARRHAQGLSFAARATPGVAFVAARALQIGLDLGAWYVVGRAALAGEAIASYLGVWLALEAGSAACRLGARAIGAWASRVQGAVLKRSHLRRALATEVDALEREGVGHLFGRVSLSGAMVSLTATGMQRLLVSVVALGMTAAVLAGTAGAGAVAWLAVGILAAAAVALRSASAVSGALERRLALSHDLTEQMAGHRTRLAQLHPSLWHVSEEEELGRYQSASARVNRRRVILELLPWVWSAIALGLLGTSGPQTQAGLAAACGGVLLARHALRILGASLESLVDAKVALRRAARGVGPLSSASLPRTENDARPTLEAPLVEARALSFAFPGAPRVVDECTLAIARGERCLLEGASGSGKSTLLQLIGGLRRPSAGALVFRGDARRAPVLVPPFHDNHLFTQSLAYNLLFGRRWPPTDDDLEDAERICRELDLGPLVERMPGGLHQIVGDSGWQLSDGERSRVFLARALLQDPELLMLDESFGALDPDTQRRAMRCVQRRARTLLAVLQP
jgi:ATP-binding cassette subfamily B protein